MKQSTILNELLFFIFEKTINYAFILFLFLVKWMNDLQQFIFEFTTKYINWVFCKKNF